MSRDAAGTGSQKRLPELLAPAGSPEALRAAIAAGADAVYLSGKRFGARKFAANFSDDEIREAVRLAHTRGIRVYVTVNTLIHDRELRGVAEYLVWLWAAGVDAVLVQDTGVAVLAREIVPELAIHASTQMTIHNSAGVLRAAEQGFSRVVLSRELSLAEVGAIAGKTQHAGTGLEVFAHGALCYSFSGQCLLSSVIGGRSGNRGMCAQPCRKPYTLVTGEPDSYGRPAQVREVKTPGRYLLSPKDLCTYRHLPELVASPVVSLKIEGRMKSPEYVAIVVSTYRKVLDAIAAGDWRPDPGAEQDLLLAFNRGFTRGYLLGDRHATLMARDAPDNRGICIGTVTKQDNRTGEVTVRLAGTLVPETGDGLLFCDPSGAREEWGFLLNNAPAARDRKTITFTVPRTIAAGASVFITSRRELEARARQIIARPPADLVHRVPVDLAISVGAGGQICMDGMLDTGPGKDIRVSYRPDFTLVPARSRPLTCGQLEAQARKSGDTPFVVRDCSIAYDGSLFAPLGELNRMRREFFSKAEEALLASSVPSGEEVARARQRLSEAFPESTAGAGSRKKGGNDENPLTLTVYTDSVETTAAALREGCSRICFEPAFLIPRHTCGSGGDSRPFREQGGEALALCRAAGARFVLKLPKITRDYYLDAVLPEIALLQKDGLAECLVENAGAAHAIRESVPGMILSGGTGLNVFNHVTACRLPEFRSLTLSPELSGEECRDLIREARSRECHTSFALVVQGITDAMVTEDCPCEPVRHCRPGKSGDAYSAFYGIRDVTGRIFPVMTDGECRTRIGNAAEICLIDHLPAIRDAGISEIIIDARGRTGAYAAEMTAVYRDAIRHAPGSDGKAMPPSLLKERIKAIAYGGITAGHYIRGLKE